MPHSPEGRRARIRRQLLRMMLLVLALHGTAIGIYYLADLASASSRMRSTFTVIWLGATFALVLVYLRRIRRLRRGR